MLPSPCRIAAIACLAIAAPARAEAGDVPYWASVRVDEVNMRVGPSEEYRIVWTYRRALLPVKVLRLKEGWRLVEDVDGATGWMLGRFLSRQRTAMVTGEGLADMREKPDPAARLNWRVEQGVVGQLGDCDAGWCRFEVGRRAGFVEQARLWGDGAP